MAKDKAKDDKFFNCSEEHEFEYVSGLYQKKSEVYDYLKKQCKPGGKISYSTHKKVYEMIRDDLGYPIPN